MNERSPAKAGAHREQRPTLASQLRELPDIRSTGQVLCFAVSMPSSANTAVKAHSEHVPNDWGRKER